MGVGPAAARYGPAAVVAVVTGIGVLATPTIPWHTGVTALVFGMLAAWRPEPLWAGIGLAACWSPMAAGPVGPLVAVAAIVGLATSRSRLAWGIVAGIVVIAAKQLLAARAVPAAADPVPELVVRGLAMAGAVAWAGFGLHAGGGRRVAMPAALAFAGLVVLARLALVFRSDGLERLYAAEPLGAVPLVYDVLATSPDPALLAALVTDAPDRDAAALALGWEHALDLGWRPQRADGVAVPVARALEARGRGGEALRLLARHPREGDVDAWRALLERLVGAPVGWKGAVLGPTVPGEVAWPVTMDTNGRAALEFTATEPLSRLEVDAEGTDFEGPPTVRFVLDAAPPVTVPLAGATAVRVAEHVDPGPHRVAVVFEDDRFGPGGDRNVRLTALRGIAAEPHAATDASAPRNE